MAHRTQKGKRKRQSALGVDKAGTNKVQSVLHRFFTTEEAEPIIALKRVERAGLKSQQTKSAPPLGGRTVVSSDIGHRNKVIPQDEDEDDDGILLDVFASTPASEGYSDSPHSTLLDEPVLRKIQDSLELDDDFLDQTIFATRKQKKGPASISSRRKKKPKARLKYTLDTLLAEPKEQFSGADDFIDELKSPIKEDKREDHNNSMDEMLKLGDKYGRDKVPIVVFTKWPQALPLPVYSPVEDSHDFIDCILSQGGRAQEMMIKQAGISSYFCDRECPEHIMAWLFNVAAFSEDGETAIGAWQNLQSIITASNTTTTWMPTYSDFQRVFEAYGAEQLSNIRDSTDVEALLWAERGTESRGSGMLSEQFPLLSFTLIIRLIGLCICHSPTRYQEFEVCNLIEWMCRFLFDPHVEEAIIPVEETLGRLVQFFSEGQAGCSWEQEMPRLCRLLRDPSLGAQHPNHMPILMSLPLTRPCNRLRSAFAYALLASEYQLRTNQNEPEMVRQLSEMVASIRITVDTDYSRLCTIISLMDSCLCSEECLAHRPMQHLPELRQSFDALNHQIREVRGYNLMITKVKDLLTLLIAKIDLLLIMHKRNPLQDNSLSRYLT